jgi:Protein of unknown function (DUF1700)
MTRTPDQLVNDYLRRLDRDLSTLPRARRREVVQEISEHIAEARAPGAAGEAATLNVLERLGDPAEIAAEARARFGVRLEKAGPLEIAALVLLLTGGFFFGVGWLVGLALLWSSGVWSARDKLIGTLVFPGGLALPVFLFMFGAASGSGQVCYGPVGPGAGMTCTGGQSTVGEYAGFALLIVLLVGCLSTTVYLARRMRERSAAAAVA